ncbi:MAG: hypothetical protein ACRD44_10775 [Bryobacteraceae bacterium]
MRHHLARVNYRQLGRARFRGVPRGHALPHFLWIVKVGGKRCAEVGVNGAHDLLVARRVRGGEIVCELFERPNPRRTERFNVMFQFGPTLEAMLAGDRELCIGERGLGVSSRA